MTDAELVEAVAREVMGCNVTGDWGASGKIICKTPPIGIQFDPFSDLNDLFMVLGKADEYQLTYSKTMSEDRHKKFWCIIWKDGFPVGTAHNESLPRAALEAALTAERGRNENTKRKVYE